MTSSEINLIKRAQAGDLEAFEALYEQHYTAVYTYIYYRVGHRPTAEDLAGDVFEKMVTKINSWQPRGKPFIAWLYTIAGNIVRNHVKRENYVEWHPLNHQDADHGESVMAQISKKLQTEQLVQALHQLTEDQRQVIVCRFLKGDSISAVATALGKTETGIKALQRRALQALNRQLSQQLEVSHA